MDCVCFAVSKMLEFFGKRQRNQHKFEQTLLRNLSGGFFVWLVRHPSVQWRAAIVSRTDAAILKGSGKDSLPQGMGLKR